MSQMARTPDFLYRHANLTRRIRDLETGVHPTTSDNAYFDEIDPTPIEVNDGSVWEVSDNPVFYAAPYWQRRAGTIMLSGVIIAESDTSGESVVGTLPSTARPRREMIQQAALTSDPYRASVRITVGGQLSVLPQAGEILAGTALFLDGLNWTTY